jgi:hypothetical protein
MGTTCAFAPKNGEFIIGVNTFGQAHVWFTHANERCSYPYDQPDIVLHNCHADSISISSDNTLMTTRYEDTISIWNISHLVKSLDPEEAKQWRPVVVINHTDHIYPGLANVAFSPDNRHIAFITSSKHALLLDEERRRKRENLLTRGIIPNEKDLQACLTFDEKNSTANENIEKNKKCFLKFINVSELSQLPPVYDARDDLVEMQPKMEIVIGEDREAIVCKWNKATNQIYLTYETGDLKILYSPVFSQGGILQSTSQFQRRKEDKHDFLMKDTHSLALTYGPSKRTRTNGYDI